jgi:hypothetical protein
MYVELVLGVLIPQWHRHRHALYVPLEHFLWLILQIAHFALQENTQNSTSLVTVTVARITLLLQVPRCALQVKF